ncbi:LOB domain-containing protein 6 [Apostasia shenzhenica]|uniref:LOB domain-containing protein 6 n=1 Tax=Apostasia shenzhenica TaxID=1088818 RepID=A0A2I0AKY9_9ASPA|nr:LOB domain-containing protein 6 [Apostasia shenzhenica]
MESLALTAMGNGHGGGASAASAAAPGLAPNSSSSSSSLSAAAGAGGQTANSPCAGCKFLRRKCQPDCVFAPYFPPDQPQKFVNVHRVFGASNVTKILNELHPLQREDAVNSLAYEAEMRLRDPVYGCVGIISLLQHQLRQLQIDLSRARSELSKYQSAAAGLGMEHFLIPVGQQQQQQQQQRMVMMRGYASAADQQMGNGGVAYDPGLMAAMTAPATAAAAMGQFNGQFARSGTAARGDDRHSTLGST